MDYVARYRPLRASEAVFELVQTLINSGQIEKASELVSVHLKAHPGDFELRKLGIRTALLLGQYDRIEGFFDLSSEVLLNYPELATFAQGWYFEGCLAAAGYSGIKLKRDMGTLHTLVLKQAEEQMATLPYGIVTDGIINVQPEVLALLLLLPGYGANRSRLFDRIIKLEPHSSFVLELQAQDCMRQQKGAKAVEFYKKALNARATKERREHLKKLLAEAEKFADYQKIIGEPKRPATGGGGG